MCTLSIITLRDATGPVAAGYRVVMNRDEQMERPEALAPRWRTQDEGRGPCRVLAPTDPASGGTWIAATSRGMVFCLLNLNPEPAPPVPGDPESRGGIIGRLVTSDSPVEAMERLGALDLSRTPPFRLVCVGPDDSGVQGSPRIHLARWDLRALAFERGLRTPLCLVSSGLGDSRVAQRLDLFAEIVAGAPTPALQDQFHRHRWPDRPHVSVMMDRGEARTVSVTTVEVTAGPEQSAEVRMSYLPVPATARTPVVV